jgi:hypothetical protein
MRTATLCFWGSYLVFFVELTVIVAILPCHLYAVESTWERSRTDRLDDQLTVELRPFGCGRTAPP